jgi:hypothetical protein
VLTAQLWLQFLGDCTAVLISWKSEEVRKVFFVVVVKNGIPDLVEKGEVVARFM